MISLTCILPICFYRMITMFLFWKNPLLMLRPWAMLTRKRKKCVMIQMWSKLVRLITIQRKSQPVTVRKTILNQNLIVSPISLLLRSVGWQNRFRTGVCIPDSGLCGVGASPVWGHNIELSKTRHIFMPPARVWTWSAWSRVQCTVYCQVFWNAGGLLSFLINPFNTSRTSSSTNTRGLLSVCWSIYTHNN